MIGNLKAAEASISKSPITVREKDVLIRAFREYHDEQEHRARLLIMAGEISNAIHRAYFGREILGPTEEERAKPATKES